MRLLFLLLFLAGSLGVSAQDLLGLTKIPLAGKDYVRITQWGRTNQIDLKWLVKDKQLRATNDSARMIFEMNSRRAQINGISFMLSRPVMLQEGNVYISFTDLEATIHPILFPKKLTAGETIKTICLDAGHGGSDPGKIDGEMLEKKYTLLLAEEVGRILKVAGFEVVQTRERDQRVELWDRPRISNQRGADLFLSLHFNAAANKGAQGVEVYCLTPEGTSSSSGGDPAPSHPAHQWNAESTLLAFEVQKALVKSLHAEDRGVKRAQLMVLLTAKMPAILIEGGFMSSPVESKKIYDSAYRKRMALAIVDGVLAYKRAVEKSS